MMFGCVSEYFANLRQLEMQNLCFEPEYTISGTKVVKHPFYSIEPKMMPGFVSEHFEGPIRRTREGGVNGSR
jgi:hypothetical protein